MANGHPGRLQAEGLGHISPGQRPGFTGRFRRRRPTACVKLRRDSSEAGGCATRPFAPSLLAGANVMKQAVGLPGLKTCRYPRALPLGWYE